MPIRILLVDDHTLFRSGMRLLLQRQPDFEIVAEAGDGVEGLKRAKELKPDVVLLDLNMPGPVSYTHLDVYKRQRQGGALDPRGQLHRFVLVEGVRQERPDHLGNPADRLLSLIHI